VLVTPTLAFPENSRPVLPPDRMIPASDAEQIFLGKMEENYAVGSGGMRGGYTGAVGFVLD
jgi:pilus assembly protein CpaC